MSGQYVSNTSVSQPSASPAGADGSVPSPVDAVELIELAEAVEEAPVVQDEFIPFTETVFESREGTSEQREVAVAESVREDFGSRVAGVFRGLQRVRKMLAEGNFLGAASLLARVATVSRNDTSSLSRFREAQVLLRYTESARRSLAAGDVDAAVLKLETGMGEVAAAAQDTMDAVSAKRLVRNLAKVRALANDGDYEGAVARARQMIGRYGDSDLDRAFEQVIQTLETIGELRSLRTSGLSGRLVLHSQHSFSRMLDGVKGVSRFVADQAGAAEPRELDEAEPVEFGVTEPDR